MLCMYVKYVCDVCVMLCMNVTAYVMYVCSVYMYFMHVCYVCRYVVHVRYVCTLWLHVCTLCYVMYVGSVLYVCYVTAFWM